MVLVYSIISVFDKNLCWDVLGDINTRVTCTGCFQQIILRKPKPAWRHPLLRVLLCKVSYLLSIPCASRTLMAIMYLIAFTQYSINILNNYHDQFVYRGIPSGSTIGMIPCLYCFVLLQYTLWTIKRWQYICDRNSGKSWLIFIIFALL